MKTTIAISINSTFVCKSINSTFVIKSVNSMIVSESMNSTFVGTSINSTIVNKWLPIPLLKVKANVFGFFIFVILLCDVNDLK